MDIKLKQSAIVLAGLMALQATAQNPKPAAAPDITAPSKDKISYAIGMDIANGLKQRDVEIDPDTLAQAMKDVASGAKTRMTDKEASETLRNWQMSMHVKMQQKQKEQAEKNQKAGEEFMAKKAKEPGVKVLPSGLAYKVIKEGTGPSPKATDTVTANYKGTLVDGTEFDSSYSRNQPFETRVSDVIKGWTEALQLMKVGSKWELYIPYNLAYGESQRGPKIGPKSTLIFEMELLSIKNPQTNTAEVVSGEIIKVPSADELKKGAKIEVIKAGQTNKVEPKKN